MMTDDEKSKFASLLSGLAEFFRTDLNEIIIDGYWAVLRKYAFSDFQRSVSRCVSRCQFMPKPIDLIQAMPGYVNAEDYAARAWMTVAQAILAVGGYHTVQFADPLIGLCVRDIGGWRQLAGEITDDQLEWKRKEFLKLYAARLAAHDPSVSLQSPVLRGIHQDSPVVTISEQVLSSPRLTSGNGN